MRFSGTCESFAAVSVSEMVAWISAIAFEDWPQQHRLNGQLRPAMVTDRVWHRFGEIAEPVVDGLMDYFPSCMSDQWMLSVVMPGHAIEPHCDEQPPHWLCRVHVPLTTNDQSQFIVGGVARRMTVGQAYRVNTEIEHSVMNDGDSPRIHFMFDVRWRS